MKRNYVEIFVCLYKREKAKSLFEELSNVVYFDSYEALKEKLNHLDYGHPHIVIVDYEYIKKSENRLRLTLHDELMYKGASVGIYGDAIPLKIKEQLYALEFKGIFDEQLWTHKEILNNMIQRSNFYAATFRNNFVKSMLRFHNIKHECRRSVYLLNFLVEHYKIPSETASEIRLAFVFLMIAFTEDKLFQTSRLLKTLFKSKETSALYQNYIAPKTFSEAIVSQLLLLNPSSKITKFTEHINRANIPQELKENAEKFAKSKSVVVSSYQDINFFLEELNILITEEKFAMDDALEGNLTSVYEVLNHSLNYLNFFFISLEHIGDCTLIIKLHISGHCKDYVKEYTNSLESEYQNVVLRATKEESTIEIEISKTQEKIKESIAASKPKTTAAAKIIDTRNINSMHYKTDRKISASEFLQEFEVEQYLLDELNENESEMKTNLYVEEQLSQIMIDSVVETLNRYVRVLHGTIEFEDIAFSLRSLADFIKTLDIEELEESKKDTLRFYIYGLINDLSSWKQYIFIEPNTPDIHYLDASLLENCAEIEKFITQKTKDAPVVEEEDDMEFF